MKRQLALLAALTALLATLASPANAYDKNLATEYASTWWNKRNASYPAFGSLLHRGSDCANFVSQALHAGGYSFKGAPSSTLANQWWIRPNSLWYDYSPSWAVSRDLRTFLLYDIPGGISAGTAPGYAAYFWDPPEMSNGDVLIYDWGKGEGLSHSALQTGYGTDPDSLWQGNFVDQHSNDRHHAFWSLMPYNANWATTTIYFVHVSPNNY